MVFINEGQVAQTQQTNLELIQATEQRLEEFIDFLFELFERLAELQQRGQSAPVDIGDAALAPDAMNATLEQPGNNSQALLSRDRVIADISATPDAVVNQIGWTEAPHSFSYQSDRYSLEGTIASNGSRQYQVSDLEGRCCFAGNAVAGCPPTIEHLDSHLSPDDLAQWDVQLSAMKTLNARPQKDLDWVKECYAAAPDWCPAGTSAILVADQVMNFSQSSTFYSDKVGMTFTRTEGGIDLIRQDHSVACRLDASGIQSSLTPRESACFRDAYSQFVQAQSSRQQYTSSLQVKLPEAKGIERTPFSL